MSTQQMPWSSANIEDEVHFSLYCDGDDGKCDGNCGEGGGAGSCDGDCNG